MFENSIKYGELGEHTIWNFLVNRSGVRSVVDVRHDKIYQSADIDFLVENYERQFSAIEVKTDYQADETGNIVYELTTNGNVGCFEKTKAQYIMYFVPRSRMLYLIGAKRLRAYVHDHSFNPVEMGDGATGYLIPISDLVEAKVIMQVYEDIY